MESNISPHSLVRLLVLYKTIVRMVKRRINEQQLSVTVEQLAVLMHIRECVEVSQQHVALLAQQDKSAIHRIVSQLSREGLVHIKANESDRRRKALLLTEKGALLCDKFCEEIPES